VFYKVWKNKSKTCFGFYERGQEQDGRSSISLFIELILKPFK
jgi:hypothetical protein